ncbi:MAG: hypothetical protein ACKVZJ_02120 [Phycisphaerales bacterium]
MRTIACSSLLLLSLAATGAAAPIVNLTLVNGDDSGAGLPFNTVEFLLANVSTGGESLTGMTLTVGDTAWNFDNIYLSRELFTGGDGTQIANLLIGDRTDGGAVTDLFQYAFTGFTPGVNFRGQFDIDNDDGTFQADSRRILFNNGAAPNAVLTLDFSGGSQVLFTLPDGPLDAETYTFTIPAPGAACVMGLPLVMLTRRRRA